MNDLNELFELASWVSGRDLDEMNNEPPRSRDSGTGDDISDPRIVWTRDATVETPAMIEGIEKICHQACMLLGYTVVVIRTPTDNHVDDPANGIQYRPHIDLYMGHYRHGNPCLAEMLATGTLFYYTDDDTDGGIPTELAAPGDTGGFPGMNPELYDFGTESFEKTCEELWDRARGMMT